jgi:hypothetical protein
MEIKLNAANLGIITGMRMENGEVILSGQRRHGKLRQQRCRADEALESRKGKKRDYLRR